VDSKWPKVGQKEAEISFIKGYEGSSSDWERFQPRQLIFTSFLSPFRDFTKHLNQQFWSVKFSSHSVSFLKFKKQ
jgi:hypothetical protein